MTQDDLFTDARADEAGIRSRAWLRCLALANRADSTRRGDPVAYADVSTSLADARLAKDLADGLGHYDLGSGVTFYGYGTGTPAGDAIERQIRGQQ